MLRWNDIRHIRKTIWKGTYQVSHLLTVFSSSANFYIYIAKVAKKIVLLKSQMFVTCHSRLMYQNIYIFSTALPVLKAKRLLRQLRLFSWPTMVLIAFPSQVWVFIHAQPLFQQWFCDISPSLEILTQVSTRGSVVKIDEAKMETTVVLESEQESECGSHHQLWILVWHCRFWSKWKDILNSNVLVNFVFPCVIFWVPVNRWWYKKIKPNF